MPLYDHFRPPLADTRSWGSFALTWAVATANQLNRRLPRRFQAEPWVRSWPRVELDLPEGRGDDFPEPDHAADLHVRSVVRSVAQVRDAERGGRIAAAVELVHPAQKGRPTDRTVFAGRVVDDLRGGRGLIVVDVVTRHPANLHAEVMALLGTGPTPADDHLYAVAYALAATGDEGRVDIWARPLAVGQPLPTLPLQVLALGRVPVDLDASYREACDWSRIPA